MNKPKIYLDSPPACLVGGADRSSLPARSRYLATFHSGYPYSLAAERLARQAESTGWFDHVDVFHPASTLPALQAFPPDFDAFVRRNPRGYGYFRWKPLLVQAMLAALPEDAHFYYMDAGCELSVLGAARLAALDRELDARGVLCFEIAFEERGWCKREAVDAVFGDWNDAAMNSRQIQATWFGLRNTPAVRSIIAEWARWATQGELITDSLDPGRQHPLFKGHRHDQSLWSLVLKKHGVQPMPQEDCFEKWLYVRNSWALLAPVHGLRSRGGRSRIDHIVHASSEPACRDNLQSPSPLFRTRLAGSRMQARLVNALRRVRDGLKPAAAKGPQPTGARTS